MTLQLDQDQSVPATNATPDPNRLRLAVQLGQPLAGYMPPEELLRSLVEATRTVCGSSDVQVTLVQRQEQELLLRAHYDEHYGIRILAQAATDPIVHDVHHSAEIHIANSKEPQNAIYYLPIQYGQLTLGVLRAEGHTATHDTTILELLASFAACGLASSQVVQGHRVGGEYDKMTELIERTRVSAMSELAAAVSHQLNNPLTTILADTEILMMDTDPETRQYRSLSAVARAGRRAAEVVRRLMAVSRPDKLNGTPQPVSVTRTIDDVLQLIRRYIEVGDVQIVKSFADDIPPIWIVPDSLEDVWMNLLMNARDALIGREDALIGIDVSYIPGSNQVQVVIWDNGVGISRQKLESVFDPFYTTKSSVERMGLGLHNSKQIIEGLNGEISVSLREEGGTQFTVRLPVKKGL